MMYIISQKIPAESFRSTRVRQYHCSTHFAYKNVVYVSMEDEPDFPAVFDIDLDPKRIIRAIESIKNTRIDPENTLLIFDEIQAVPKALTSLKYF